MTITKKNNTIYNNVFNIDIVKLLSNGSTFLLFNTLSPPLTTAPAERGREREGERGREGGRERERERGREGERER